MTTKAVQETLNPVIESLRYEVAYPNVDFQPDDSYLRVNYLGSRSEPSTFGQDRIPGILQVDAVVKQGSGAFNALEMADKVKALFEKNTVFEITGGNIRIDMTPTIGPAIKEDGWYFIPISIPFEVYS